MSSAIQDVGTAAAPTRRLAIGSTGFAILSFAFECVVIVAVSVLSGVAYHQAIYGMAGDIEHYLAAGGLAALAYTMPFALKDHYDIDDFLEGRRAFGRIFLAWNYVFLALAVVGFLTKSTGMFSRGWLLLFYAFGLFGVIAADAAITVMLRRAIRRGLVERRRLMVVGTASEIARCVADIAAAPNNVRVVTTSALPDAEAGADETAFDDFLEATVLRARLQRIEDIVIVADWAHASRIEQIVSRLATLPVGVHVGASSIVGRFVDTRMTHFGAAPALSLKGAPLTRLEALSKRAFDIAASSVALVMLAPLFAIIALAIKLDSSGPVFFRQRRRGYNLVEFRIWKFRTMTTLDDGPSVQQAKRDDLRVTRVGRLLRRYNFDELPQLLNVLAGEMSLVGPRPHAVAHDLHFEKLISEYPRRLNMRPGITGWAQVHGFRGATETADDMRRRVDHDIYYIENWSLVLDLYILVMTVLSPKAYRNAY